jgi:AraC-like DNA-binding protein
LRIEHAIELIKNQAHTNLTVEAVGMQSGFKSRSTFYAAFKEYTQQSPAEFLNTLTNQKRE